MELIFLYDPPFTAKSLSAAGKGITDAYLSAMWNLVLAHLYCMNSEYPESYITYAAAQRGLNSNGMRDQSIGLPNNTECIPFPGFYFKAS